MFLKMLRNKKGAALVEYGLLVAGVALVATVGIAILGHKTSDLVSTVAAILPGAHPDDNNPILSGKLIETAPNGNGALAVDAGGIAGNPNGPRLADNLGIPGADLETLVQEP